MSSKILRGYRFLKNLPAVLHAIRSNVQSLQEKSQAVSADLIDTRAGLQKTIDALGGEIESIKQRQADLVSTLASLELPRQASEKVQASSASSILQADNHALDSYYVAFEDKFRGSEEDIYRRLKASYTDLLTKGLPSGLKKLPIVDIGCGRGELLKLLKELKLTGVGIDLNKSMVNKCKQDGYEAKQEDALTYLRKQPSSSIAAIGGIHIVEHIPFEQLLALLQECFRTVAPGGFVFFETPNAENVVVGSLTFWYDSSHLKPVPPDALAFILQYVGFGETKILRLHPDSESPEKITDQVIQKIADKVFGPRDYAAIGIKSNR